MITSFPEESPAEGRISRTKKGGLGADEEDGRELKAENACRQPDKGQRRNGYLHDLSNNRNRALAVAIGEIAAQHGKEDERHCEEQADDGH